MAPPNCRRQKESRESHSAGYLCHEKAGEHLHYRSKSLFVASKAVVIMYFSAVVDDSFLIERGKFFSAG
jgi:hypothetical protein